MPRRTSQPLGLIHHQQVDAGLDGLPGQLGALDQQFERDHGAAMQLERVEAVAEVFRDIRPVNTTVIIAGLVDPRWHLEIDVDAVVG